MMPLSMISTERTLYKKHDIHPECIFCPFSDSSLQNPLVETCSNGCVGHAKCFKNFLKQTDHIRKSPYKIQTFKELAAWLIEPDLLQGNRKIKYLLANTKPDRIILYRYRGHLIGLGFVNHKWPNISFLDRLYVTYSKALLIGTYRCLVCGATMCYIGRRPKLLSLRKWYVRLSNIMLVSWAILAGLGMIYSVNLFGSLGLISALGWRDEFFPSEPSGFDILRANFVPHLVYCLVSPRAGILNILAALAYSHFDLGVPLLGLNRRVKRFLGFKLFSVVLNRLFVNRYFLKSFRQTIPALFGQKLTIDDAWEIQESRNNHINDKEYMPATFWGRVKMFFKDTWNSLTIDFSNLYKRTNYDFFFQSFGEVIIFATSLFIRPLVKLSVKDMYYSESERKGISTLICFGILQLVYYEISNYEAMMLSECYKNLKPSTGQLARDEAVWIPMHLNRSLGL